LSVRENNHGGKKEKYKKSRVQKIKGVKKWVQLRGKEVGRRPFAGGGSWGVVKKKKVTLEYRESVGGGGGKNGGREWRPLKKETF